MLEYKIKQKFEPKKLLHSKVLLFIALIMAFFILRATSGVYDKLSVSKKNLALTSQELKNLEDRADFLKSEIKRLESKEGIEEEIRDKFRVSKAGEKAVFILDGDEVYEGDLLEKRSIWQSFLNFFR